MQTQTDSGVEDGERKTRAEVCVIDSFVLFLEVLGWQRLMSDLVTMKSLEGLSKFST